MLRNALFAGTKAPRLRTDRADMGHPAGEIGDGTIEGDSSADYACGSAFSPFSRLFGIGATYQWFYRDTQYVFKKMEPCPDPMDPKPVTCTANQGIYDDPIPWLYEERVHSYFTFFGIKTCMPTGELLAVQFSEPSRPFCYDLP